MYILEKCILGTQILMLGFLKNYQVQLFYVLRFPLPYLTTAQKTVQSSQNAEKLPKPFSQFLDISYKDKNLGKIPFLKKFTLWVGIGVKKLVPLIADNVYRATFKKSIENEK